MKKILMVILSFCVISIAGCAEDNSIEKIQIIEEDIDEFITKMEAQENIVFTSLQSAEKEYKLTSDSDTYYYYGVAEYTYMFCDNLMYVKLESSSSEIWGSFLEESYYTSTKIYDYENAVLYTSYGNSDNYLEESIYYELIQDYTTAYYYYVERKIGFLDEFFFGDDLITSYEYSDQFDFSYSAEINKTNEVDLMYFKSKSSPYNTGEYYSYRKVETTAYSYSFTDSVIKIPN